LFGQRQLDYLGHVISGTGVQPDPSKVQVILDWPRPSSPRDLRAFLGLTGFYRKFVRGYASIAAPLTQLLCKDAFYWNEESQKAFHDLKLALTAAPVLALPDFSLPFSLETDASSYAMGAVLHQRGHPIAFFSKPLGPRLQHASAYVRELHAIVAAVRKWRQYLLGHRFIIYTDHRSIRELISQTIQTPEQQFYLTKLLGFDYDIQYKAGNSNVVADSLSRISNSAQGQCLILSVPHPEFLQQLKQSLLANPDFRRHREAIQATPTDHPDFSISGDFVLFKGAIWINEQNPFIPALLHEYHASPLAGHFGVKKTLHRLRPNFQWTNMLRDIKTFVRNCHTCQQVKPVTRKSAGLLHPIPIPSTIWEDLSMDFVTHLPSSNGFTTILVVVDRFSKGVHLGALPAHYTAFKVANLFLNIVCKLHGFPRSIISDRDPIFISSFWRELFRLSGTTLRMSTAYHPQSDGQTEVMNRTIEQYLRSFVHHNPANWFKFLALAEWSYNTSQHSGTDFTPYEVTYGKPPPAISNYIKGSSRNDAVDTMLATRDAIHATLRRKLLKAQENMKLFADKSRRDVQYEVGQLVYVRLRPHRQHSLRDQTSSKLTKRYFGPFPILERIGTVAYRLQLPEASKIHPVFHCSMLRPHHGPLDLPVSTLPPDAVQNQPIMKPLTILDSRMDSSTQPPTRLVLVQWEGLTPEDSSWEVWDDIRRSHHLEDKVIFAGRGNDEDAEAADTVTMEATTGRPRREVSKPRYLVDYV